MKQRLDRAYLFCSSTKRSSCDSQVKKKKTQIGNTLNTNQKTRVMSHTKNTRNTSMNTHIMNEKDDTKNAQTLILRMGRIIMHTNKNTINSTSDRIKTNKTTHNKNIHINNARKTCTKNVGT